MSEEEKKAIENVKLFLYKDKAFVTADEIDLVFNLIEKQQKEIEGLKNNELDYTTIYINGKFDGEKKYKDKIKARIKELENKPKHGYSTHSDFLYESDEVIDIVIDNLKELLEENNNE